jgi:hypothetical protein
MRNNPYTFSENKNSDAFHFTIKGITSNIRRMIEIISIPLN